MGNNNDQTAHMNSSKLLLRLSLEDCLVRSDPTIPAINILRLSLILEIPAKRMIGYFNFASNNVIYRACFKGYLTVNETEIFLGFYKIIKKFEAIAALSCQLTNFDFSIWLGGWVRSSVPALSGAAPGTYLSTLEGQAIVENLLDCSISGAYF